MKTVGSMHGVSVKKAANFANSRQKHILREIETTAYTQLTTSQFMCSYSTL